MHMFLSKLHETIYKESTKSSCRPNSIRRCLEAFYGHQSRNQAIFSVFHGCYPMAFGGTRPLGPVFLENYIKSHNKSIKSSNSPSSIELSLRAFYVHQNKSKAIFSIIHRC